MDRCPLPGYTFFVVNAHAQKLLQDVLALPDEERDEFARELLTRLEEGADESDATPSWTPELERRARAALEPGWQGRDADEALRAAETALSRVR
jgi:hypothetical protein